MKAKKIVSNFYKSDVLLDVKAVDTFLHPDFILEWNSSKGFLTLNKTELLQMSEQLSKAYVRSKNRITHLIGKDEFVTIRYSQYVKTIENPREEMLLAHFMVIWEIKDEQLYRGFQMSQLD